MPVTKMPNKKAGRPTNQTNKNLSISLTSSKLLQTKPFNLHTVNAFKCLSGICNVQRN